MVNFGLIDTAFMSGAVESYLLEDFVDVLLPKAVAFWVLLNGMLYYWEHIVAFGDSFF